MFKMKGLFENYGAKRLVPEPVEYAVIRSPVSTTISKRLYWKIAPTYYRKRWSLINQAEFDSPLDPFKILWVSPEDIV